MRTLIRNLTYTAILTLILSVISVAPARAAATAETYRFDEPLQGVVTGCGEDVAFSGTLHTVMHVTFSAHGGYLSTYQQNLQDVSGIGLLTGARYRLIDSYHSDINWSSFFDAELRATYTDNFRLVGQGPAANTIVTTLSHVTITNSQGITAFVDHFTAQCH
jgi:hypothetical protein